MSQVSIQGTKIHYIQGESFDKSRPTLLFLHGAGQSVATWKFQLEAFRNHPDYNFIAPNLPGHGESNGTGLSSVDSYKEFVLDFIRTLELSEVVLVGHSMGGGIAMLIALEHPEFLNACVFVATSAKLSVAQQTLDLVKDDYPEFCNISPTRAIADESPDEIRQEYKKGLLNTDPLVCYNDLVACDEFDIVNDIERINTPTLIVSADKDIMTPPKRGEYLHQKIYGSKFHLISGSGHFLMQEKAQEFNSILLNYISDFIE